LGHEVGDQMLRNVANQLRHCVRGEDSVARLGGDEFILLLRSLQQPQDAGVVAKKIIAQLSQPLLLNGHSVAIGASVGIALYPADSTSKSQLIRFADLAMYRAKSTGKGNLCFYSKDMERIALDRLKLESSLRAALVQGELMLYYQPIVDLRKGTVKGQEALIRWRNPQQGLLPPAQFIPFSEQSELIFSLDKWVLQHACSVAQAWQALGAAPQQIAVNVNLSGRHFRQPQGIVQWVRESLEKAALPASLLEIEVTETAFMQASQETIAVLAALRELGVRIAIDDFGVGYSSLNFLKTLPLDVLKLDRSFLLDVPGNHRNAALAAAIIQLGITLELEVVAEGVETQEQWNWLQDLGCQYGQGYLFAHPAPQPQFHLDDKD
jgi:predicted signal transduction protein with EAL and GGDEF domain